MVRNNIRPRLAAVAAAAMVVGLLLPAAPASADDAEIVLDQRCMTKSSGNYPIDGGMTLSADAKSIEVRFPAVVRDHISEMHEWGTRATMIGPGGAFFPVFAREQSADGVTFDLPANLLAGAEPGGSFVVFDITSDFTSAECPPAAEWAGRWSSFDAYISAVIVDGPEETAVLDLDAANRGGIDDTGLIDWSAGPRPSIHWGDTVTLVAEPGYFTHGPGNSARPIVATARLNSVSTTSPPTLLADPVISQDGSSATVTLPGENPESDPELARLWTDPEIWITLGAVGGGGHYTANAGIHVLDPTPPVITAQTPTLKSAPKVLRSVKAVPGTWGPAGVTLHYQWLVNGKPISGATKSTYTPKARDYGKRLSVRVTGTLAGSVPVTLTSKPQKVRLF
jgi:hypothetical protein